MAYCMYLRKSRADLAAECHGAGETLSRHKNQLFSLAEYQNLSISKVYSEIVSGETIESRPVMQQLLNEVGQCMWEGVLVADIERLARGDTKDQGIVAQTFKYSNTLIVTLTKTYDPNNEFDEEYFEYGLFMSRREYKTINRRMQRGRLASVNEGKYVGSKPPFGYMIKKLNDQKGYTLEPQPEQAETVSLIYDLYVRQDLGPGFIARELDNTGSKPQFKDTWSASSIRGILKNPVYAGYILWNKRPEMKTVADGRIKKSRPRNENYIKVRGLHRAIIDEITWNKAQDRLSAGSCPKSNRKQVLQNSLSGLVRCGVCGRNMTRRPVAKAPDFLICTTPNCTNIGSYLSLVEEDIILAVSQWLGSYKFEIVPGSAEPLIEHKRNELAKLERNIKIIENQLDNLHDLLEQGVYSVEKFNERYHSLNSKIEALHNNWKVLSRDPAFDTNISRRLLFPTIQNFLAAYTLLRTPQQKNRLLRHCIKNVVYTKSVKGGRSIESQRNYSLVIMPWLPDKIPD